MADAFPGSVLVFDAANRTAVKMIAKTWLNSAKIKDVGAYFAVSHAPQCFSEAAELYRESLRLQEKPCYTDSAICIAQICELQGAYAEAIEAWNDVMISFPISAVLPL